MKEISRNLRWISKRSVRETINLDFVSLISADSYSHLIKWVKVIFWFWMRHGSKFKSVFTIWVLTWSEVEIFPRHPEFCIRDTPRERTNTPGRRPEKRNWWCGVVKTVSEVKNPVVESWKRNFVFSQGIFFLFGILKCQIL